MKKRVGRPTKFKPEFIDEMYKFFNIEPERREVIKSMVEYDEAGNEKRKAEEFKILPAKFPSLFAFSRHLNVPYERVRDWAESGKDIDLEQRLQRMGETVVISKSDTQLKEHLDTFRRAYQEAKQAQKDFLINVGLSGASPSSAFIFTAKNVTDMRDKVETEISHRMVSPLLEHMSIDNAIESLPNPPKRLEN